MNEWMEGGREEVLDSTVSRLTEKGGDKTGEGETEQERENKERDNKRVSRRGT